MSRPPTPHARLWHGMGSIPSRSARRPATWRSSGGLALMRPRRCPTSRPPVRAEVEAAWKVRAALAVVGRPEHRPELMKPNTRMVEEALRITDVVPSEAVLIGDAVSDVQVAHAAGVRAIGHAKNPRRGEELRAAAVDALTETMSALDRA